MRSPSRRALGRFLAPVATLLAFACGDGPSEPKPITLAPGVRVVGGMGVRDTIEIRARPLVLELVDERGRPRAGVPVRFEVPTSSQGSVRVCLTFFLARCPTAEPFYFADSGTVVSDERGTASMPVWLWQVAGTAWVRVIAPTLGVRDSVKYVVRPGRAIDVVFTRPDTTVYVGTRFRRTAVLVDRLGNATGGSASLTGDAHVAVAANGELVATSLGPGRVTAHGAGRTRQLLVSVNPRGVFAAADTTGIFVAELDGSGARVLAPTLRGLRHPAWSADGRTIFADQGFRTNMVAIDVASGTGQVVRDAAGQAVHGWSPSPSRDGTWLYFAGPSGAGRMELATRRVESIAIPGTASASMVAISPDGRLLAFETTINSQPHGKVLDLATRALTPTDVPGWSPRWSPDGTRIAFVNYGERLAVADADGANVRALAEDGSWRFVEHDVDWTEDGGYLLSTTYQGFRGLRVSTGAPLFLMHGAYQRDIAIRR